jgi:hypothetical protein
MMMKPSVFFLLFLFLIGMSMVIKAQVPGTYFYGVSPDRIENYIGWRYGRLAIMWNDSTTVLYKSIKNKYGQLFGKTKRNTRGVAINPDRITRFYVEVKPEKEKIKGLRAYTIRRNNMDHCIGHEGWVKLVHTDGHVQPYYSINLYESGYYGMISKDDSLAIDPEEVMGIWLEDKQLTGLRRTGNTLVGIVGLTASGFALTGIYLLISALP